MRLLTLEVKFSDIISLRESLKEITEEIKEGYTHNYDGLTEVESYSYNVKLVAARHELNHLENSK
jgi:hypothetical protein